MDIVYVVKNSKNYYKDIRYSLRSLVYLKDYDKVWLIGDRPCWIKDVIHIPCPDDKEDKQLNVINKILLACCCPDLSENFILMNDDFYFLENTYSIKNYSTGGFKDKIKNYEMKYPNSEYTHALKQALKNMERLGIEEPYDFEIHYPIVFNKEDFKSLFDKYVDKTIPTVYRSIYANYYKYKPVITDDFKIYTAFPEEYDREFLSTDDEILNDRKFLRFMNSKFPKKSKYEI
jgi:hypothetical protein